MTTKNSHILIVDDNPDNVRVLGTILEQNNYRMTIAPNGELALKAAEDHIPDLILLDVMMPEMDGFQVCEALKANPRTKGIEIIFVTAAVTHDDELKGLSLGAVDYIHKPFSIPIVQAKVALHLERVHHKRLRDDIERITRHDLKTPLNVLMGYPQLMLLDDNLTAEQHGYLEEMLKAGNEMLHMINNSLDLFKMETGHYQYIPEEVEMVSVIEKIIRDLRMLTEAHRVKTTVWIEEQENVGTQSFMVWAEHNLSYSLFANLIRNAIEACSVNDTINIAMRYEDNYGVISITNPGTVPETVCNTFFEKYTTAGKAYGTGLGTYSAKLMTETQNGKIAMMTNSKETCITVRLPKL
jgi:DNA-binding response OmpR family regulator